MAGRGGQEDEEEVESKGKGGQFGKDSVDSDTVSVIFNKGTSIIKENLTFMCVPFWCKHICSLSSYP